MDGIEAVIEQPTEVIEQPSVESEVSTETTEEVIQPEAEEKVDGRTGPRNIQNALKTLKEAHPELAKDIDELRKGYFSGRQHSEFFKSPAEARQAKATLDLVGGAEGISNLQSQIAAI